ncbi:MAG: hypothetical protein H0T87_11665 [Gammaproteobacteria bacterium]|nr:hypothetical protein [Gammaproteobacteria bacterium]
MEQACQGPGAGTYIGKQMAGGDAAAQRRSSDRRRLSWWTLTYGSCCGRRARERRYNGPAGYIDRYEMPLFAVSIGVFVLGCVDACLTLRLLAAGATEVNPLLDAVLRADTRLFLVLKFVLTAIGLVLLVLHKNFTVFYCLNGQIILQITFAIYVCLVGYEAALLSLSEA